MTALALAAAVLALGLAAVALLHSIAIRRTMARSLQRERMAARLRQRKALADEHEIPVNGHRARR